MKGGRIFIYPVRLILYLIRQSFFRARSPCFRTDCDGSLKTPPPMTEAGIRNGARPVLSHPKAPGSRSDATLLCWVGQGAARIIGPEGDLPHGHESSRNTGMAGL